MKITKLSVLWKGLMVSVDEAIRDWRPNALNSELEYRDDLIRHLRKCGPEARVEPEYRHAGTTTDICFKWDGMVASSKTFVEPKRNLRRKSQYDGLVGQLEGLDPKNNRIIVVLCANTNETLAGRLRHHYRDLADPNNPDHMMSIIEKK